jgi:RNA polymerase sigma-70 factor (ECF subfamily)
VNPLNTTGFTKLFHTWYEPLCHYAFKYVDDRQAAEDLVQDVFTRMWNSRAEITIGKSLEQYLFRATRNACLGYFRKKALDQKMMTLSQPEIQWPEDPEKELHEIQLKLKLRKAVDRLPPKTRNILILHKLEGLTYQEISRQEGISVKTIEKQLARAYRLLRVFLAD